MSTKVIEGFHLSPQQAHVWSLQQHTDDRAYRAQCMIAIEGRLDSQALETALNKIIGRHEILRTAFQHLPGMSLPLQVIGNNHLPLPQYDLSNVPPDEQGLRIDSLLHEMNQLPIDLENGLPMHVWLVKTAPNKHTLLMSVSSLCMDATGLKNLFYEFGYAHADRPGEEELASDPMQYADFSDWQNEILTSEETLAGRAHWQQIDFSDRGTLNLPLKKSVTEKHEVNPQVLLTSVDATTIGKIEHNEFPLSTVLLTCLQLLLSRLTQQTEIVTGVSASGRNYEELETALGLFVKFVPVRAQFSEQLTFDKLVREVEQQVKDAEQWQEFFNFKTGSSDETLPHISFNYELFNDDVEVVHAGGLQFKLVRASACSNRSDLLLRCLPQSDGSLIAEWQYDGRLYTADDIKRLAGEWHTLVASVSARPQAKISTLNILGPEERAQLLFDFNQTAAPEKNTLCLHELFETQAKQTPDAVALEFNDERITYRELDQRANRVAQFLRRKGVTPETRVAILVERSIEMVIGMLGILKAGGAYVPLDAEYPAERLALMLKDCDARVVVTQERLQNVLDAIATDELEVVRLDSDWKAIENESDQPVTGKTDLSNVAYVIYTSGSTGRPKGVMIQHAGICNRLLWIQREFPMTGADSLLQKTPISFDASVWEIFVPLISGARLVIAEPGGHRDSAYLVDAIAKHEVTTLQLVPSMLRVFLDEPDLHKATSLRRLFCGGESLPVDLQQKFFARLDAELHNLYGPTETSIDATFRTCKANDEQTGVLIGKPISNIQVYLLNSRSEPVPIGCSGELHVGGIGLARGYLKRPDLTAERFIPNPFSTEQGQRLYKTGDLARHLADGTIEYLGRIDHQVKLRGFRIELGEIETALCEQRGVKSAVVVPREDEPGHQRLVAYILPTNKNSVNAGDLQLHRLPNQIDVNYLNLGEAKLLHEEIFVERAYLKHGITLHDGDCVFDIGANIGMFTLFVHEQCRDARVFACEPIPPIFDVLQKNAQLYDLPVKLYQCGISNETKTAEFTFYPRASATSGMYADRKADEEMTRAYMNNQGEVSNYTEDFLEGRFETERYSCQLLTVSDIIRENKLDQVDLLKVDVEKSELDVLNGIRDEDWQRIRQIVIEVHDSGGRLEAITSRLEQHGFEFVVEQDKFGKNTGLYNIYAIHPNRKRAESIVEPIKNLNPLVSIKELRHALEQRLPDYMVPSAFALLEELPRLPNGKIDRASLPAPDKVQTRTQVAYAAPRNAVEEKLTEIWKQVLGLERVGIHDNFFELGGDSILSIQIVARANQAGLKLSPKLIFRHQTIAQLSEVAVSSTVQTTALQGLLTGEIPLTPIQRSFFEQQVAEQHHFNQSLLLEIKRDLSATQLQRVVRQLALHHDALRLRFKRDEVSGEWRQYYAGAKAAEQIHVEEIHLREAETLESKATKLQSSLNLEDGPVIRVALINIGANQNPRLLIAAHHLAIDGVSWRILLDDLELGIDQDNRGETISFGPKTTSYGQWSERLAEYAQRPEVRDELPFWSEVAREASLVPLPLDFESAERTLSSSQTIIQYLDVEETRALLQEVPAAYHTQINDALLTALVEAIGKWNGQGRVAVEMEGHGREEIFDDVDLSRTVGWFTSVYPVVLDLEGVETPGEVLKQVKEQLRRIPGAGLGYGLLRYSSNEPELQGDVGLSFNYLGQLDQVLDTDSLFAGASEYTGPQQSLNGRQRYALEVSAAVTQGKLYVRFTYNEQLHTAETIREVINDYMQALRELITHCQSAEAGGFTPSDFALIDLNQAELDLALREIDFS